MYDYDAEIQKAQNKIYELKRKRAKALRDENEQIGRIVREVFQDNLPDNPENIKSFFEELYLLEKNESVHSDVQGETAQ